MRASLWGAVGCACWFASACGARQLELGDGAQTPPGSGTGGRSGVAPDGEQIAFTPDGSVLMALIDAEHTHATNHSAFQVWDAPSGALLRAFGASSPVLGYTADGARLATGSAIWCR